MYGHGIETIGSRLPNLTVVVLLHGYVVKLGLASGTIVELDRRCSTLETIV
jgi:hypothetical protein